MKWAEMEIAHLIKYLKHAQLLLTKQICSNTKVNTHEDNLLSLIVFYLPSVYVQSNYIINLMPLSVEIFRVYLKDGGFCFFVVFFLLLLFSFVF